MNHLDFTGKVVLVTGSSQGIGAVIATEFAKHHAVVVLNYPTEKEMPSAQTVLESLLPL